MDPETGLSLFGIEYYLCCSVLETLCVHEHTVCVYEHTMFKHGVFAITHCVFRNTIFTIHCNIFVSYYVYLSITRANKAVVSSICR